MATETQVREAIKKALKNVSIGNSPEVYKRIQSKIGYQAMEAKIIKKMLAENMVPSEAIPQIEQEYNLF